MIMSGPDERLPLGVHCDGVSEFFFLRAYKRPVSDSLPGLCSSQQFMCL